MDDKVEPGHAEPPKKEELDRQKLRDITPLFHKVMPTHEGQEL